MLYNFQRLCMYLIFWLSKELSIMSISYMRIPKLWVVKEVVQSHTDDTSKRNHWISVLIKIQSSFYLITLGKCAINFRWYRNPSHHSHYSFCFSDLCTIIRCVPLISSVCVCVFSWDTWLGIHLNIISHYNDENQKFKTLKKWNNNTYIFFILKIKFRY